MRSLWLLAGVVGCSSGGGELTGTPAATPSDTAATPTTDSALSTTGPTGDTGAATSPTGLDADGDGVPTPADCDDDDPLTYPGAPQRLLHDADCDGFVESDIALAEIFVPLPITGFIGTQVGHAGDGDGDGRADLWMSINLTAYRVDSSLLADGYDVTTAPVSISPPAGSHWSITNWRTLGDIDGDGATEQVVGYLDTFHLFPSAQMMPGTVFEQTHSMPVAGLYDVFLLGDVDGDGARDIGVAPDDPGGLLVVSGGVMTTHSTIDASQAIAMVDAPHVTFVGLDDVTGDGLADVLFGDEIISGAELRGTVSWPLPAWGSLMFTEGRSLLRPTGDGRMWDVDGDGVGDLLLLGNDDEALVVSGDSLGVGGSIDASQIALATIPSPPTAGKGNPYYAPEAAYAPAGDLDGDGLDELALIWPTGPDTEAVYLFSGAQLAGGVHLAPPDAMWRIDAPTDATIYTVLAAGDVNGDGHQDLAVGTYGTLEGVSLVWGGL